MRRTLGEVLGTCATDVSRAVEGGAAASKSALLDGAQLKVEGASFALDLDLDMAHNQSDGGFCLFASHSVPTGQRRRSGYRPVAHVEMTLAPQPVGQGPRRIRDASLGRWRLALENGRQLPLGAGSQKLTDEFTDRFGSRWSKSESAFVMDCGPALTLVLVWHVNLCPDFMAPAEPLRLVKFSKTEYAIRRAEKLRLATADFYRRYEGAGSGIRDEMEARQVLDIQTAIRECESADPARRIPPLSGEATYVTDSHWLYCTAITPTWEPNIERLQREFSAECATSISDPSSFAIELGKAFAGSLPTTQLDGMDDVTLSYYRTHQIDHVVQVFHGPVIYTDASEPVFAQPAHLRGIASCFVKRQSYEWQREYRFSVSTVGEPADDVLELPISETMKELAEPVRS